MWLANPSLLHEQSAVHVSRVAVWVARRTASSHSVGSCLSSEAWAPTCTGCVWPSVYSNLGPLLENLSFSSSPFGWASNRTARSTTLRTIPFSKHLDYLYHCIPGPLLRCCVLAFHTMDYSPALSASTDFSDMTDEELDKYFASCAPLSNLPTPPPTKDVLPIVKLSAEQRQTPELEG